MKPTIERSAKLAKIILFLILGAAAAAAVFEITGCGGKAPGRGQEKKIVYTCPMHHQIRRDAPGECPICGMTLIPLEKAGSASESSSPEPQKAGGSEKKIKFWANPMNPAQHSDKPMKASDGMDYVPVFEAEEPSEGSGVPGEMRGLAPVHLSAYKEQLIGVKYATARKAVITRLIHTIGRFAGGENDFASLAGDFAARKSLRPSGRYVVADIYALDLPFVKVGQKAVVTALSGQTAGIEGRVDSFYPFDGTQSRVTRIKIRLAQAAPRAAFANVEIKASSLPTLAVPSTAVLDTGTKRYEFVQTAAGNFSPREIQTGYEGDDLWEVLSGLKEGDQIVDGALYLIDADSKLKAAFSEDK